jgi:hypothetical protein
VFVCLFPHTPRVFENRVLRRIYGPRREGVKGGLRELRNQGLPNLCSSLIIIRIIESRRVRTEGHIGQRGEKLDGYIYYWWEIQKERDH